MTTNLFKAPHIEVLKWFQTNEPALVSDMRASSHHYDSDNLNPYHIEGDVWTHTLMVFKVAEFMSANNHHVKWSALLHDIGKYLSREVVHDRKRVRFIGHTGLSAFMAIDILNRAGVPANDVASIFKLIAVHDKLFEFVKVGESVNEEGIKKEFKYARALLWNLLEQARADSLGRFYEDGDADSREYMRTITTHFAPILKSMKEEEENVDRIGDETKPVLTLLVGPPCSGKSTWLKQNVTDDTVVLSRDNLVVAGGEKRGLDYNGAFRFYMGDKKASKDEVDNVLARQTIEARKNGQNVVVDMTNMTKSGRRRWLNDFKNYTRKATVFVTGFDVVKERNVVRAAETGKNIPYGVLKQMCQNFTLPMRSEGFESVEYVVFKD